MAMKLASRFVNPPTAPETVSGVQQDALRPTGEPQASFAVRLTVCLFISLYLVGTIRLLFNVWVANGNEVAWILGMRGVPLQKDVISIVHVVLGAVLGAGVLGVVSFHHYVSVRNDFQTRHCWGYFFAPIMAAALSIVTYALLRSGLLVFSGGGDNPDTQVANYGYLAVGFLSGFGWYEAVQSIRATIKRFFSSGTNDDEAPQDAKTAGEAPVVGETASIESDEAARTLAQAPATPKT